MTGCTVGCSSVYRARKWKSRWHLATVHRLPSSPEEVNLSWGVVEACVLFCANPKNNWCRRVQNKRTSNSSLLRWSFKKRPAGQRSEGHGSLNNENHKKNILGSDCGRWRVRGRTGGINYFFHKSASSNFKLFKISILLSRLNINRKIFS